MAIVVQVGSVSASGRAENGKKLFKTCIACHGRDGHGIDAQKAPRIAGQFDWYILKALNDFKTKQRVNPTMLPFIAKMSNQDYQDLAAFVSTMGQ